MDGDKVKVQLFAKRKGAEPEGEVVEILESKERTFVGKLQVAKGFCLLDYGKTRRWLTIFSSLRIN